MDKSWQMCVVDRSIADFSEYPEFNEYFLDSSRANKIMDGEVVFVVTTTIFSFSSISPIFRSLKTCPEYSCCGGILFAYVWYASEKKYGWIFHSILKPILNEQDAIEAETKFGISLEEYI